MGGWGWSNSWVGSFSRTKQEVHSGTKIYLIWILSVIFEFSATIWLLGTKYLIVGADILIFGAKISKSCLFKVNWGGGGGGGLGTPLREVSASVSGKKIPPTPCYELDFGSPKLITPPRGVIKVVNRVLDIRSIQWLGWVFETKERKKESSLGDKPGEHPGVYLLRTNWVRTNHLSHED